MWTADVSDLNIFAFDLHRPSYPPFYKMMERQRHTNYARWIPVHLRDMVSLNDKHPGVFAEFSKGTFVVKKTTHVFSGIAINQAHEQNNAL